MPAVGEHVQRFEVVAHLGTGGMGAVFRARDPQLERDVAIKLLARPTAMPVELSEHETLDLRSSAPAKPDDLLREARMMARLSHPNVLPVYEVGLAPDGLFVVMEHIEGSDLRSWLPGKTPRQIRDVFVQAGRGLVAAHAREIVHGDFKPENVLVGADQRVRVADFGLSRIVQPAPRAMLRVEPIAGTPHYMAPELWDGAPPSKASDVYAFCVALHEALGGEPHPLVAAGRDGDPARRPSMEAIVDALAAGSRRRRWPVVAGAGVLAIGATAAIAMARSSSASCDLPRREDHWTNARRGELRAALAPAKPTPADRDHIERIVAQFDEVQRDLDARELATCEAERDGRITEAEALARRACLDRRQLELDVRVDQLIETKPTELGPLVELARTSTGHDCDELIAPPVPSGRLFVGPLYRQLIGGDMVMPKRDPEPALVLARVGAALGDRELEVRATLIAASWLGDAGKLDRAEELLERGFRQALELRDTRRQAMALNTRARHAVRRGDPRAAASFGNLALAIADRETTPPLTRARVYADVGKANLERGDAKAAIALFDKGLAVIAADGHRLPFIEHTLRLDRVQALGFIEGNQKPALAAAREAVDWTGKAFGEDSAQYGSALSTLASFLRWSGDLEGALAAQQQSIDVLVAATPNAPTIANARGNLAFYLMQLGRYEEARQIYIRLLDEAKHNELLRSFTALMTVRLGVCTFNVGRHIEGHDLVARGVELGIAQYGSDHTYTTQYRDTLKGLQLELGKLDDAERTIETMRRFWNTKPDEHARSLVALDGATASIALKRGKPVRAEAIARAALARWDKLGGDDSVRSWMHGFLGEALNAQRKFAAAKLVLDKALAFATSANRGPTSIAAIEVALAESELGLGKRAEGRARALRARGVLAKYPGEIGTRRAVAKLLR